MSIWGIIIIIIISQPLFLLSFHARGFVLVGNNNNNNNNPRTIFIVLSS